MKSIFVYSIFLPIVIKVCDVLRRSVLKPKTMLILRGNDGIGDFVVFSGALRIIRESYPNYHITLLVTKRIYQLLDYCPYIDDILIWDIKRWKRSLLYKIKFICMLRIMGFEWTLEPRYQQSTSLDAMVLVSNARYRIGMRGEKLRHIYNFNYGKVYSKLINPTKKSNELDKIHYFLRELIGRDIQRASPEIWLSNYECEWARAFVKTNQLVPGEWVIISPGSSDIVLGRRWSVQKYAKIIDLLWLQYNIRVVLTGSQDESSLLDAIDSRSSVNNSILMPGTMNLRQFAALIKHSTLCIGNESAPIHLSIAMGTPTVCVLGGGHFGKYMPYGDQYRHRIVYHEMDCFQCDWQCIHKSILCIEKISIEDIWRAITALLKDLSLDEKNTRQHCS